MHEDVLADIHEMVEFARGLEAKGYAYKIPAGLYFDTAKVRDYGKLALSI